MKNLRAVFVALTVAVVLGSYIALAQQPAAPAQGAGQGRGAPGGGRGPTGRCRSSSPASPRVTAPITAVWPAPTRTASSWAAAAGRGDAGGWHAYLSTQGPGAVNARDRIGNGPWYNSRGQTCRSERRPSFTATRSSRRASATRSASRFSLTEKRARSSTASATCRTSTTSSPARSRTAAPTPTRADHTCSNCTSNANVERPHAAPARRRRPRARTSVQLGHSDKQGGGNGSWNSTHASRGCSQPNLVATGGAGLLYCFAVGQ